MTGQLRDDRILWPGEPRRGTFDFWRSYLTVWPNQVGIVMCDGKMVDVFTEGKRMLPKGEVLTYMAPAQFKLRFWFNDPDDASAPAEGVVLDQPVRTSDRRFVTGSIDLELSVIPNDFEHLLKLLRSRPVTEAYTVTLAAGADTIKGELQGKVLALDISDYRLEDMHGNRELLKGINDSLRTEMGSTLSNYGLRLDNFYVNWGLTFDERERFREQRHEQQSQGASQVAEPSHRPPGMSGETPVQSHGVQGGHAQSPSGQTDESEQRSRIIEQHPGPGALRQWYLQQNPILRLFAQERFLRDTEVRSSEAFPCRQIITRYQKMSTREEQETAKLSRREDYRRDNPEKLNYRPAGFTDETVRVVMNSRATDCLTCAGQGATDCLTCAGRGGMNCPRYEECLPTERCRACGGEGIDGYAQECRICRGHGEITCRKCGGYERITCQKCQGSEWIICSRCINGQIICSECGGDRRRIEANVVYLEFSTTENRDIDGLRNGLSRGDFSGLNGVVEDVVEQEFEKPGPNSVVRQSRRLESFWVVSHHGRYFERDFVVNQIIGDGESNERTVSTIRLPLSRKRVGIGIATGFTIALTVLGILAALQMWTT